MTRVGAIALREVRGLWATPLAWVLLTTFLLLQGGIFYSITVHISQLEGASLEAGPLEAYFGQQSLLMSFSLLLLCPGLTMRALAEERRSGNIELLLSAPISSADIVLGKYLGALVTYALIWAPTAFYALSLRETGTIYPPTLVSSYLGVGLVGASYLAIGVLMSGMARSQLTALLLTTFALFGFFILGIGEYVFEAGLLRSVSGYVSLIGLLEETSKGLIDTRRVVFHLSVTAWALFVTTRVVDSWRSS